MKINQKNIGWFRIFLIKKKIELSCELVNLLEEVKDKGIVSLKPFESKVYKNN